MGRKANTWRTKVYRVQKEKKESKKLPKGFPRSQEYLVCRRRRFHRRRSRNNSIENRVRRDVGELLLFSHYAGVRKVDVLLRNFT